MKCLNIRFPLPTLLFAVCRVKLCEHSLRTFQFVQYGISLIHYARLAYNILSLIIEFETCYFIYQIYIIKYHSSSLVRGKASGNARGARSISTRINYFQIWLKNGKAQHVKCNHISCMSQKLAWKLEEECLKTRMPLLTLT